MFLRVVRAAGGKGVTHEYARVVGAYLDCALPTAGRSAPSSTAGLPTAPRPMPAPRPRATFGRARTISHAGSGAFQPMSVVGQFPLPTSAIPTAVAPQ